MWIVFSILAAALWGLSYALAERFLKQGITPAFLLFIRTAVALPVFAALTVQSGRIDEQFRILREHPRIGLVIITLILCYIGASLFILMAIGQKNATAAGLIEISYPLFIAGFAWFLFRDLQMNAGIAVGAALIMSGIFCVGYFSKA